jgi:hypothetical protein
VFEGRQNFMIHYRRRGRLRSTSVLKNVLVRHGTGQSVRILPLVLNPLRLARGRSDFGQDDSGWRALNKATLLRASGA